MSKMSTRWPIWKIAVAAAACLVAAPVLYWLGMLAEQTVDQQTSDPVSGNPIITFSSLLMMLAMATGMLGILGLIWLGVRIQDARTPVWKKKGKKTRF